MSDRIKVHEQFDAILAEQQRRIDAGEKTTANLTLVVNEDGVPELRDGDGDSMFGVTVKQAPSAVRYVAQEPTWRLL
jgi:hypothetical protein